jgi:hypothetical protein
MLFGPLARTQNIIKKAKYYDNCKKKSLATLDGTHLITKVKQIWARLVLGCQVPLVGVTAS